MERAGTVIDFGGKPRQSCDHGRTVTLVAGEGLEASFSSFEKQGAPNPQPVPTRFRNLRLATAGSQEGLASFCILRPTIGLFHEGTYESNCKARCELAPRLIPMRRPRRDIPDLEACRSWNQLEHR